ncbi:hypothetical protein GCM10010435_44960 [Winogradskya consettensis]|uniref:Tight adherence protein B n=1 Tax=Winogradskya consettensis TaxID=113560 RepID=A0A919T1F1_9ACTN|nr:hypothetical protein [Actinoplanes consettensis]GIM82804.1 hypothetical protein Aco04nite_83350 [Actinoplanes consettensis]
MNGLSWLLAASLLALAAGVVILPAPSGLARLGRQPRFRISLTVWSPTRLTAVAGAGTALLGLLLGGPVAATLGLVYAVLGAREFAHSIARKRAAAERTRNLDALSALAADLRAGAAPSHAPIRGRLGELTAAAGRLAGETGAPTADLVDRIEADARTADRARARANAEAAGTRMTALLLAVLPLGGLAIGYGLGTDPLRVLLHTSAGAICAIAAALLQTAGLLWSNHLIRSPFA